MSATNVQIDAARCQRDAICVAICPLKIFSGQAGEVPQVNVEVARACMQCGHCASACPGDAIDIAGLPRKDYLPISEPIADLTALRSLVQSRRSTRDYLDQQAEPALIGELLDLTRFCPTAKNTQLLHWVLVSGKEKVREISAAVIDIFRADEKMLSLVKAFDQGFDPITRGAPHLLFLCGPAHYDWGALDGATYIAAFELAAKAVGLGSCWAGFVTRAASMGTLITGKLGLPKGDKVFAAVMFGYPKYKFLRVPPRRELRLKTIAN